jgi:general secretion pathway protein A
VYEAYFGLRERPFSIAPDPQYLYMSERHQEAFAHLSYGIQQGGGFVKLTGEVGTGKTTLCRSLLSKLPKGVDVALILNPRVNERELLETICDEFRILYTTNSTVKILLDLLNQHLLRAFSKGKTSVLIIDEAQLLEIEVLEMVRLLTNLETNKAKLLQIILIGQPELDHVLAREELRQLDQRINARYHLGPLNKEQVAEYVSYRLGVAGCQRALFSRQAIRRVFRLSRGVPRIINVLCDHSLLRAYASSKELVNASLVSSAAREVLAARKFVDSDKALVYGKAIAATILVAALAWTVPKYIDYQSFTATEVATSDSPVNPISSPNVVGAELGSSETVLELTEQAVVE